MKRASARARMILVLGLIGCSTAPSAPVLQGSWGGRGMSLVVTPERVVITIACHTSATVTGPIPVNAAGEFEFQGTLESSYSSADMRVMGRVQGDRMAVELTLPQPGYPDYSEEFVLRRGWPPDYGDPVCPA
jgi:hypothetical protein